MHYIVCEKPGQFKLLEKAAPKRTKDEALLKIKQVGICGTDLHAFAGNQPFFQYPRILGHELAAEVLEIGENEQGLKVGDSVIIMPYLSCGTCIACRKGKTNCCTNIKVLGVHTDGGMQKVINITTSVLIPANDLSLDEIAIVEPLAIGAHAIRRAAIQAGELVLVIGCGPIGIGIMKLAQLQGATVIAMDINEQRLQYAQEKIGVDYIVSAGSDSLERIAAITNGDLVPAVFDATGNKYALESGIQYMAHGGRYTLVGLFKGDLTFNHPTIHSKETTLLCSRNATLEDFYTVKKVLQSGQFPTSDFITHRVPFSEMIAHFESWLEPKSNVIKAMVEF